MGRTDMTKEEAKHWSDSATASLAEIKAKAQRSNGDVYAKQELHRQSLAMSHEVEQARAALVAARLAQESVLK